MLKPGSAARFSSSASRGGGEPYECTNSWYMERIVPQIWQHIDGDEDAGIPPSDDPARDMVAVMDGMESMATSMYQGMVQRLLVPELRGQVVQIGARTARHSAAVAIESTGRPNAYISPAVIGEEVVPNESGLIPLYAIPAQFGTLNAYQLIIGVPSSAGTRFTLPLETPADNSYVYTGETCPT